MYVRLQRLCSLCMCMYAWDCVCFVCMCVGAMRVCDEAVGVNVWSKPRFNRAFVACPLALLVRHFTFAFSCIVRVCISLSHTSSRLSVSFSHSHSFLSLFLSVCLSVVRILSPFTRGQLFSFSLDVSTCTACSRQTSIVVCFASACFCRLREHSQPVIVDRTDCLVIVF